MANPWENYRTMRSTKLSPEEEFLLGLKLSQQQQPNASEADQDPTNLANVLDQNRLPAGQRPIAAPGSVPPPASQVAAQAEAKGKAQAALASAAQGAPDMADRANSTIDKLRKFNKDDNRGIHTQEKTDAEQKQLQLTKTWPTPKASLDLASMVNDLPYMKDLQKGEDRYEDMLKMQLAQPVDYSAGIIRPLAALTDSLTGSHTLAGAPQDMSHDRMKTILAYADKAQDNRRDIASKYNDTLRSLSTGSLQDQLLTKFAQVVGAQSGNVGRGSAKPYDPNKDVQAMAKRMEGLESFRSALDLIDKNIPGGIDGWKGEKIAGIEPMDKLLMGISPKLVSDQANANRQAYKDLQDALLRAKSGAQINEAEYNRLKATLGDSALSGSREFVNAIRHFRAELGQMMKQREAGFSTHPEVLDLYRKGGGVTSDSLLGRPTSAGTNGPLDAAPASGSGGGDKAAELLKRIDELEKKKKASQKE